MIIYLLYLRILNYKKKSYNIDKEKHVGVKGKLKEVKYNKMLFSIHSKHYIVAHHYFLLHNMVKHSFRLKCNSIQMVERENLSIFFIL